MNKETFNKSLIEAKEIIDNTIFAKNHDKDFPLDTDLLALKKARVLISRAELIMESHLNNTLIELLKKAYYQGFQDANTDNYHNGEDFINSIIAKQV